MFNWLVLKIAGFGDLVVSLMAAGMTLAWLVWRGRFRSAAWWAAAVAGCVVCVAILKLGFYTGFLALPETSLRNPSGHTAMSIMVYGGAAWLVASSLRDWRRPVFLVLGMLAAASVGLAMVDLGRHTVGDFTAGGITGAIWVGIFARFGSAQDRPLAGNPLPFVLAVAAAAIVASASHLTIGRIGVLLQLSPVLIARF